MTTIFFINSCIIVKNDEESRVQKITLSPKPVIPMSDELVRSKAGDMISNIPEGWFFVEVEDKLSADIFSVAVNPDYTLAAVFSSYRKSGKNNDVVLKEGLLGLARLAYDKRFNKSGGSLKQYGKYSTLELGTLNFGRYDFLNEETNYPASSVVFISSLDNYYEFSLIPLKINQKMPPSKDDFENIFKSILATIQY